MPSLSAPQVWCTELFGHPRNTGAGDDRLAARRRYRCGSLILLWYRPERTDSLPSARYPVISEGIPAAFSFKPVCSRDRPRALSRIHGIVPTVAVGLCVPLPRETREAEGELGIPAFLILTGVFV